MPSKSPASRSRVLIVKKKIEAIGVHECIPSGGPISGCEGLYATYVSVFFRSALYDHGRLKI
jgi:hypothetical protein